LDSLFEVSGYSSLVDLCGRGGCLFH
jgi:hypothetical protein